MDKRLARLVVSVLILGAVRLAYADDNQQSPTPPQAEQVTVGQGTIVGETVISTYDSGAHLNGPEYVDQNTGVIHQFGDGNGNIISREAFIERSHQIEAQFNMGANRILGEAHVYMKTASRGEDSQITQGVISGIEQSKQDVHQQHAQVEAQAKSVKPRVYEKAKVLVSE